MKKTNTWVKSFCWASCFLFCGLFAVPMMKAGRILENSMDTDIWQGWDKIHQDGGVISLRSEAAYAGNNGAGIQLSTPNKDIHFYKGLGGDLKRLNSRFYLYLNDDLDLKNNTVTLYSPCSSDWNEWLVHCQLKQENGEFSIFLTDPIAWYVPTTVKVEKNRWYCVEVEAASGTPGSLKLYLDGSEAISIPQDYNFSLGHIILGVFWKNFAGECKGSIYLDEVVIDDSDYIGPKQ